MYKRFTAVLTTTIVILIPLFFWTITPNFYSTSKLFLVLSFTLLALAGYFIQLITTRSLTLNRDSLSLSLILFLSAITLSLLVSSEGRPEALAGKGVLLLTLPLLALSLRPLGPSKSLLKNLSVSLMALSFLLALHSLFQLTFLSKASFLPSFMQTKLFTPTGDYLTTLILILSGIAVAIPRLNLKETKLKIFPLLVLMFGIMSCIAIISLMLPGSPLAPILIPYKETWAITLDALKSLRSLFFGVGLANYSLLFTAVKPLSLNATSLWNALPQTGTSELLTLFATSGIVGGLSTIFLFLQGLKTARHTDLYFPLLLLTFSFVLIPGSIPLYTLYFVILAAAVKTEPFSYTLKPPLAFGFGFTFILLVLVGYGYSLKPILAENYMLSAQTALKNSDGKRVYDLHLKAIKLAPRMTMYHLSFAETNLSLASALSQKQNLSDQEKNTVSTLVQQAVSEGKNAISLHPNSSAAWLNLAKIYRNLINVASGADTFAIDNYARAVALDPANPSLRIEFGGLFYQLGGNAKEPNDQDAYFGRAKTEFQTAIQLRPNYPNAYYNLAKLFETTKDYEAAYLSMQKALSLLGPDNQDLSRATAELETIKSKLPKPTPSPSLPPSPDTTTDSSLAAPLPLPSPLVGDPIELNP